MNLHVRQCSVCTSPDRSEIERSLADAKPYRLISAESGLSESAIRRHANDHLGRAVLHPVTGPIALADLADRMSAVLNDTASVREHAARTNNPSLLLKACSVEASVLGNLIYRLGINDTETATLVGQGRDLVRAVREACGEFPELARVIADHLNAAGSDELSRAFQQIAERKPLEIA